MELRQGKYLTFLLGEELYGIPILKVKEIICMMTITHVPRMPEFVKGVINLRGMIIPVIDLRLKFGLEKQDYNDRTCIIVVEMHTENGCKTSGLVVDTVSEVLSIAEEAIEESLTYGNSFDQQYLTGIGKVKDRVVMLLETEKVLSPVEMQIFGRTKISDNPNTKEDSAL